MSVFTTTLSDRIFLTYRNDFKFVFNTLKDISKEIYNNKRRKKKSFVVSFIASSINRIYNSISTLYNSRCSEDSILYLLTQAVQKTNSLIYKLREYGYNQYLDVLEKIYQLIVKFLGDDCCVQLELFSVEDFHKEDYKNLRLPGFWRWYNYMRSNGLFSKYPKFLKIDIKQLVIPFKFSFVDIDGNSFWIL